MVPADKVWIVTDASNSSSTSYGVSNGSSFMYSRDSKNERTVLQSPLYCPPGSVLKHTYSSSTFTTSSVNIIEVDYTGVPVILTQPFYDTSVYSNGISGTSTYYNSASIRVSTFIPVDFEATSVDIAIDDENITHGDVNVYTTSDDRQEVSFALVKPDNFIGEVKITLTIHTNQDESYVIDVFRTFTGDYYAGVDELNYEAMGNPCRGVS